MARKQKHKTLIADEAGAGANLNPCLGKVRFDTEEAAIEGSSFRPYYCGWCNGWHTSAHGFKGSRKGR